MTEAAQLFDAIVEEFTRKEDVLPGKMMSASALKAKGKVFAFFHNDEMTFKLGKDFDPEAYGLQHWSYLSPFKNKPPMKAWYTIPFVHHQSWDTLTRLALDKLRG